MSIRNKQNFGLQPVVRGLLSYYYFIKEKFALFNAKNLAIQEGEYYLLEFVMTKTFKQKDEDP